MAQFFEPSTDTNANFANSVSGQTNSFFLPSVYSKKVLDSPRDSPWGETTREQKVGLEFSLKQYDVINKYCKRKKIPWYLSCWDVDSQIQMRSFKTKYNKVASAMLLHKKLVKTIAEEGKYTFISTGMSTIKAVSYTHLTLPTNREV